MSIRFIKFTINIYYMIIIITGTPGTGKTKIAKLIAKKLELKYIDVNKIINKENLKEKYEKDRQTHIVDEKKLANLLNKLAKTNPKIVIDSHMSHYMDPKLVDLCIVTKCDLKTLKKRLEKRKYSSEKIRENLDAEIFDICFNESLEAGFKIKVIDTTKNISENMIKQLKNDKNKNK